MSCETFKGFLKKVKTETKLPHITFRDLMQHQAGETEIDQRILHRWHKNEKSMSEDTYIRFLIGVMGLPYKEISDILEKAEKMDGKGLRKRKPRRMATKEQWDTIMSHYDSWLKNHRRKYPDSLSYLDERGKHPDTGIMDILQVKSSEAYVKLIRWTHAVPYKRLAFLMDGKNEEFGICDEYVYKRRDEIEGVQEDTIATLEWRSYGILDSDSLSSSDNTDIKEDPAIRPFARKAGRTDTRLLYSIERRRTQLNIELTQYNDLKPGREDLSIMTLDNALTDSLEIKVDYSDLLEKGTVFEQKPKAEYILPHEQYGENIRVQSEDPKKVWSTSYRSRPGHPLLPGSRVRLSWRHLR